MCKGKDKPYMVYVFLILFGIVLLMLCGALREARDDIGRGYTEQGADDETFSQMIEVVPEAEE